MIHFRDQSRNIKVFDVSAITIESALKIATRPAPQLRFKPLCATMQL